MSCRENSFLFKKSIQFIISKIHPFASAFLIPFRKIVFCQFFLSWILTQNLQNNFCSKNQRQVCCLNIYQYRLFRNLDNISDYPPTARSKLSFFENYYYIVLLNFHLKLNSLFH